MEPPIYINNIMKTSFYYRMSLFLLLPVILLLLPYCKKSAGGSIRITSLVGKADKNSGDSWQPVAPGELINQNDTVRTQENSIMDLSLYGQVAIRLLGSTEFSAASLARDSMNFKIDNGNILVKVGRLRSGSRVAVESPTAVASVRGTQFWGQVNRAGGSGVFAVREGAVEIHLKISQKDIVVTQGQAVDISADQLTIETRGAKDAEMHAMSQIDEMAIEQE